MDFNELFTLFEQSGTGTDFIINKKAISNRPGLKFSKETSDPKALISHEVRIQKIKDALTQLAYKASVWQIFSDWIEIIALKLSCCYDPSHNHKRVKILKEYYDKYSANEIKKFEEAFIELGEIVDDNLKNGCFVDILGSIYMELQLSAHEKAQIFTHESICNMVGQISGRNFDIPEKGYITLYEPAAGSGAMLFKAFEEAAKQGINPKTQIAVFAVDTDIRCIHMCYIQLSLYGIPAVIQHGNSISLEAWSRWYTPVYIIDNWVWRQRLSFVNEKNYEDECLKCVLQPMYGIMVYGFPNVDNA